MFSLCYFEDDHKKTNEAVYWLEICVIDTRKSYLSMDQTSLALKHKLICSFVIKGIVLQTFSCT